MRENKLFYSLVLIVSLAVFGCQTAEKTATKNVTPKATPTAEKNQIKTANGRGKVTKINLELVSVELDHEEIPGIMAAMIMEFRVTKKSELEALKIGETVDFVLEDNAGVEKIISINKSK